MPILAILPGCNPAILWKLWKIIAAHDLSIASATGSAPAVADNNAYASILVHPFFCSDKSVVTKGVAPSFASSLGVSIGVSCRRSSGPRLPATSGASEARSQHIKQVFQPADFATACDLVTA